MSEIKLNKQAYIKLIEQDIDELKKHMPDSLERRHIIDIINHSLDDLYPPNISHELGKKEVSKKISNYRIKQKAKEWCSNENDIQKYIEGAKWMRDKLTK